MCAIRSLVINFSVCGILLAFVLVLVFAAGKGISISANQQGIIITFFKRFY